jgi:hypothetical protein
MTKSGFENNTVKNLINIVTITPLVIAGLYTIILFYDFIYPPAKTGGVDGKSSQNFFKRIGLTIFLKIISVFGIVFSFIGKFAKMIFNGLTNFKFSMINIFVLYLVFCYFLSKSYENIPFLNDWSNYINVVLILIAATMVINILTLFIKENNDDTQFPVNKGIASKVAWTFSESLPIYKSLLGIAISLGVVFLTFYLLKMFKFLSSTINSFLMVLAVLGLLFTVFNIISKNTLLMSSIMSNKILQLLYHTIFILPCLVLYLTNFIWDEIEDTPKISWLILVVQIFLVGAYFLLPLLKKWLFKNFVTKKDRLFYEQQDLANDRSIIMNENELSSLMDKLSVDWDKIISENLYDNKNEKELKIYLMSRGYVSSNNNQRKNFLEKLIEPKLSLEAAITYVQVNTLVIIDLRRQIAMQLEDAKNISKAKKNKNNMFKTNILLDKPTYLNKKKLLGSYESIGNKVGAFNYNYAVSAWIFMHEQPPSLRSSSNKFTTILDYASKPKIQFKPSENKLRVIMSNSIDKEHVVYESDDFKLQRWNNILVNYNGGTLDIFINGELKSTSDNITPIMSYDGITIGEDKGLSGGICNVVYYPEPLTITEINTLYKSLKYKNPPVL